MSHSPIETQCVIIFYFYYILHHFHRSQKINILAYQYIGRELAAEVSSACSNSINEVQVTTWTICDILMNIPILQNIDKLYLKLDW